MSDDAPRDADAEGGRPGQPPHDPLDQLVEAARRARRALDADPHFSVDAALEAISVTTKVLAKIMRRIDPLVDIAPIKAGRLDASKNANRVSAGKPRNNVELRFHASDTAVVISRDE